MNRFGILPAFWLLWAIFLPCSPLESQSADEVLESAYVFYEEGEWDASLAEAAKAAGMFRNALHYARWLECQSLKANVMFDKTSDPYQAMAVTQAALNDPWLKLSSEEDYYRFCKVLNFQAWLSKGLGNFTQVRQDLEKSYTIFQKHLPTKGEKIAGFIYAELGNAYVRLKEYEGARQIFEDNFEYSKAHPECAKFNDYGSLYFSLGADSLQKALAIFEQGIAFNQNQAADSKLPDAEAVLLLLNKAECLAHMGRYDEALRFNQAARNLNLSKDDGRFKLCQYGLFENYGIIYAGMARGGQRSKFAESVNWYQKSLKLLTDPDDTSTKREISGAQIALAEVMMDWGKVQDALSYFHQSVRTILPAVGKTVSSNPSVLHLTAESMLLRGLHGKARAFHALGQLDLALECYELIPIVEAKLRSTHAYESSSLLALKESRERFHKAVGIAWQLFERSQGNLQFAERAFRLTELSRGMLLLQSLVQARQYLPAGVRDKDYEIRVRMAWLEHEIAAERDKGADADEQKIKAWETQLFSLKIERQNQLAAYPSYNNPDSVFLQVLSSDQVHKLLRPEQALADFFLTETDAFVFGFDAKGNFHWRKTPLPVRFREQTRQFANYLWEGKDVDREGFLRQAWALDSLLLAPERAKWGKSVNSLMIVPDDVLMLVPFETLLSRNPTEQTWRNQPWLLLDYNIGYTYSATLLSLQNSISEENIASPAKPPRALGGFAPSYSESSAYKLSNTQPMLRKVCREFDSEAWYDEEASEEKFKNASDRYRVLLLAMHGISDDERPELSRLLFGDPGPDSAVNNNVLYASELQIMQLQADLVVLSACHSGSGKLEQGEGVYSLARAFAAARVPATVMSLWLLHENTAPPLVEAFFKYLRAGKTKDQALRLAKLDFLQNDENFEMTHPFFWAGLAAVGDMRVLDLPAKPGFSWAWVLILVPLVGLGFWWQRRRKKNSIPTL